MCIFQSVKFELNAEERKNMYCAETKTRYMVFENPDPRQERGDQYRLFLIYDTVKQPWHDCFIAPGILVRGLDSRENAERYCKSLNDK